MAGTVRLVLVSVAHDSFLSFSPRPVPGSLSSLLHLHNRQRQPMPASMPGTLPNPTMPGSSAVLMPVSFLVWVFSWGRRLVFCSIQPMQRWKSAGFSKKSKCNEFRKLDLFHCFILHKSISGAVNGMVISVRVIRNGLHVTTISGSHTWSCRWDQYVCAGTKRFFWSQTKLEKPCT